MYLFHGIEVRYLIWKSVGPASVDKPEFTQKSQLKGKA
jgi:hypothetical protein